MIQKLELAKMLQEPRADHVPHLINEIRRLKAKVCLFAFQVDPREEELPEYEAVCAARDARYSAATALNAHRWMNQDPTARKLSLSNHTAAIEAFAKAHQALVKLAESAQTSEQIIRENKLKDSQR